MEIYVVIYVIQNAIILNAMNYKKKKTKDQQSHAVYDTETKEMTPSHRKGALEETR